MNIFSAIQRISDADEKTQRTNSQLILWKIVSEARVSIDSLRPAEKIYNPLKVKIYLASQFATWALKFLMGRDIRKWQAYLKLIKNPPGFYSPLGFKKKAILWGKKCRAGKQQQQKQRNQLMFQNWILNYVIKTLACDHFLFRQMWEIIYTHNGLPYDVISC